MARASQSRSRTASRPEARASAGRRTSTPVAQTPSSVRARVTASSASRPVLVPDPGFQPGGQVLPGLPEDRLFRRAKGRRLRSGRGKAVHAGPDAGQGMKKGY